MSAGPGALEDPVLQRPTLLAIIFDKGIVRRSVYVGAIVGTVLNLIAQGDFLVDGVALNWWKIVLTFCVPYCVATYGACTARLETYRRQEVAAKKRAA